MKNLIYKITLKILSTVFPFRVKALLVEDLCPIKQIPGTRTKMRCNSRMTLVRFDEFWNREPDTRGWIDTFKNKDIFWDIGANVGIYSLYASRNPMIKVWAFEPGAENYAILNRNIETNKKKNITAFPIAFSERTGLGVLYQQSIQPGKANNSFGKPIGTKGEVLEYAYAQGAIGFSIDDFVELLSVPNHIKIDVDGIEGMILRGAVNTLRDARVKSLMVEMYPSRPDYQEIFHLITASGFICEKIIRNENHHFIRNLQFKGAGIKEELWKQGMKCLKGD